MWARIRITAPIASTQARLSPISSYILLCSYSHDKHARAPHTRSIPCRQPYRSSDLWLPRTCKSTLQPDILASAQVLSGWSPILTWLVAPRRTRLAVERRPSQGPEAASCLGTEALSPLPQARSCLRMTPASPQARQTRTAHESTSTPRTVFALTAAAIGTPHVKR